MDKQYSYTDFMKAMGQTGKESSAEKLLNEIYLDMFLSQTPFIMALHLYYT